MSTIVLACTRIFFIPIEEETTRTHDLSIKGNNMKNKKMAVAGISLLGSIGVISTGFAGWIIAAQPQYGNGTGSITADATVTSKMLTIESQAFGDTVATNGNIRFAPKVVTGLAHSWLSADVTGGEEDLDAVYTVTLGIENVKKITVSNIVLTETATSGTPYATLASSGNGPVGTLPTFTDNKAPATANGKGYIVATSSNTTYQFGDVSNGSLSTGELADSLKKFTFTIGVHFAWGKLFNYQNPYSYYNGMEWNKDNQTNASTNIKTLDALNKSVGFKLTFTVSAE